MHEIEEEIPLENECASLCFARWFSCQPMVI